MAKYALLSNGSSGSDVKKMQKALIAAGYSVGSAGADGIFGSDTEAAVRKYQKAKGLDVDGIAGDKTLGSLYSSSSKSSSSSTKKTTTTTTKTAAPKATTTADLLKQNPNLSKPIDNTYTDTYQQQLSNIMNQISNGEKFTYDLNGDMMYQQYKDQYQNLGRQAMMDTAGQSAALTGGYGNSYGTTAASQAYQGYLQKLNDVIPQLYDRAYQRYQDDRDAMYKQYDMYRDASDTDYGRFRDTVDDAWTQRNFDYNVAQDKIDDSRWQMDYDYQASRDKVEDSQWQKELDYKKSRDKVEDEQWKKEYELALKKVL